MTSPTISSRLEQLISQLDSHTGSATLVNFADSLKAAQLTVADVRDHIETNSRNYNRSRVVANENYELLVMTWLPGQASAPHDHAGSLCIMQVLQGVAVEGTYSVCSDGYIDLEYETTIGTGEITSGQDAGIHAVKNPADQTEPLVTVHIYSPPLRDFRRFIPRPQKSDQSIQTRVKTELPFSVVVVGGGFSGAMTAAHLLKQAREKFVPVKVTLVERRGAIGEGVAYGTRDLRHLLNVPAGRMSAWPDRPDDFLKWAQANKGSAAAGDFLPRQWYGEYVRETVLSAAENASPSGQLNVMLDEVRRVAHRPDQGWLVHLGWGASIQADAVVLAVGHRPPDDPIGQRWSGPRTRYLVDPWRPLALDVIDPQDEVVILGSGLSAVDAVLTLTHVPRKASITMISRRGLLPQAHAPAPLRPVDLKGTVEQCLNKAGGLRAVELSRKIRALTRELATQGIDWRSVVDGLRPHTVALWRGMSLQEKRRFVRHLRPFWEIHRHRMALAIAHQFGELHDTDQAHFIAGRVVSAQGSETGVELVVEQRHAKHRLALHAAWVINCTGPAPSNIAAANPAVGSLLVDGWLRSDALMLGLDVSEHGQAMGRDGGTVDGLFVVGTLRKAQDWESTAVPELRVQAADVATQLLKSLYPKRKMASV